MRTNLLERLPGQGFDYFELLHLLEDHFGMGGRSSDTEFVYPSSMRPELIAIFDDDGISRIEPGPAFSETKFESFVERVKHELIDSPNGLTGADWAFSSRPVKGSFLSAAKDMQILVAPPSFPRPDALLAEHPFVVEFSFKKSCNSNVTWLRYGKACVEIAWALNALLRSTIRRPGPRSRHFWALVGEISAPPNEKLKWVQEFYIVDGFKACVDDFSRCGDIPLPEIPHQEYYNGISPMLRDELCIPDNLSESLARIKSLSGGSRERFFRACQWFQMSSRLWHESISSAFIALVISVESLIDPNDYPKLGATKRFKQFVGDFIAGETAEGLAVLYDIRSELAHGWSLFHYEETPWSRLTHHPRFLKEHEATDKMWSIVRRILVFWLHAQPKTGN
jgi:hypothetical protein